MNQQTFNGFTGDRLGLRMEAVVAALDELQAQGLITDRGRAFRRVWIVDRVVNEIERTKREAEERSKRRRPGTDAAS